MNFAQKQAMIDKTKQMICMRLEGKTFQQIADIMHLSLTNVVKQIKNGTGRNEQTLDKWRRDMKKIIECHAKGMSLEECSKHIGKPVNYLGRILRAEGLTYLALGGKGHLFKEGATEKETTVQTVKRAKPCTAYDFCKCKASKVKTDLACASCYRESLLKEYGFTVDKYVPSLSMQIALQQ